MDSSASWTVYFFREVPHASPDHAVAAGPPPPFRCGGRCRTIHGSMTGWHEARTKHGKDLYRLFCLHDRQASGLPGPALVLVTGGVKASETAFPETFYRKVRALGKAYLESNPLRVLR
jgi:hypothetical protein